MLRIPDHQEVPMETCQSSNPAASETRGQVPCLITEPQIAARVHQLAREISAEYADKPLLVVGVLHGAYVFMADLVRQLTLPVRCAFVMLSSYGDDTVTSGEVKLRLDLLRPVDGEHLLVVDDIVDTGVSIAWLVEHLTAKNPASLRLCVLLDKPARRRVPIKIDYVGFEVPDRFVVGYGIDCADHHRELPYIGYVPSDEQST